MKFKKLALALATVSTVLASGYAFAYSYYTQYTYYSDATYTEEVGYRYEYCNSKSEVDGRVTNYRRIAERYSCSYMYP
jgi:hypothetical protein